jgi:hypothetical protein
MMAEFINIYKINIFILTKLITTKTGYNIIEER